MSKLNEIYSHNECKLLEKKCFKLAIKNSPTKQPYLNLAYVITTTGIYFYLNTKTYSKAFLN